jgi:hypothetical protein
MSDQKQIKKLKYELNETVKMFCNKSHIGWHAMLLLKKIRELKKELENYETIFNK